MQVKRFPQDSFLVDSTDSAISPKKRLTNTCKCINISYQVKLEDKRYGAISNQSFFLLINGMDPLNCNQCNSPQLSSSCSETKLRGWGFFKGFRVTDWVEKKPNWKDEDSSKDSELQIGWSSFAGTAAVYNCPATETQCKTLARPRSSSKGHLLRLERHKEKSKFERRIQKSSMATTIIFVVE